MIRFAKLHISLFKYIRTELKKKRSLKQLVIFFEGTLRAYIRAIKQELNLLFQNLEPEYRKQKEEFKKHKQIKVDLQRALKMLQYLDKKMINAGYNRKQRKQFWRDFYKMQSVRNEVFKELEKEIR
jgi:hypothetical protein